MQKRRTLFNESQFNLSLLILIVWKEIHHLKNLIMKFYAPERWTPENSQHIHFKG